MTKGSICHRTYGGLLSSIFVASNRNILHDVRYIYIYIHRHARYTSHVWGLLRLAPIIRSGHAWILSYSTHVLVFLDVRIHCHLPLHVGIMQTLNFIKTRQTLVLVNSLASKFELRVQPLSAEMKMSPHVQNCTLNDFYVLTLPLAMGSDAVLRNLQRHLHASLWIVILCQLGVFTSTIEEKIVKHGESHMQRWRSPIVCVDACSLSRYHTVYGYSLFAHVSSAVIDSIPE